MLTFQMACVAISPDLTHAALGHALVEFWMHNIRRIEYKLNYIGFQAYSRNLSWNLVLFDVF